MAEGYVVVVLVLVTVVVGAGAVVVDIMVVTMRTHFPPVHWLHVIPLMYSFADFPISTGTTASTFASRLLTGSVPPEPEYEESGSEV